MTTPDPLVFPEDIVWSSISESLMYQTLSLTNKARNTDRHVLYFGENADPPKYKELFESRQKGYAQLGLDALTIAENLRIDFKISIKSEVGLDSNWDKKVFLVDTIKKFKADRVKAAEQAKAQNSISGTKVERLL